MIPVTLQPEPEGFDADVRQKGRKWLAENGIAPDDAPPEPSRLPTLWRNYNQQLWIAYSGICAYLAIFFEWSIGAASTDHFVAKSRIAGDVYEWSNYRLSSLGPNNKKHIYNDVLDPVGLEPHTFVINFASGRISPNPDLDDPDLEKAALDTIDRLKLDNPENKEMRARHYGDYLKGDCSLDHLARVSPFVHAEIVRQGLVL